MPVGELATVVVGGGVALGGVAADAWRRARSVETDIDRVERKIDVILVSIGVDPGEVPEYDVDSSQEPQEPAQEDGGDLR